MAGMHHSLLERGWNCPTHPCWRWAHLRADPKRIADGILTHEDYATYYKQWQVGWVPACQSMHGLCRCMSAGICARAGSGWLS